MCIRDSFCIETIPKKLKLSDSNYFEVEKIPYKFNISPINELHKIDKSNENLRKLMSLRKTKDDFNQIYEVLVKASNEGDLSTIKYACDEKYSEISDGHDINMMLMAAWNNNLNLVLQLFNYGADVRSRSYTNRTILHYFCQKGNLEGVKFALNFIDINAKNIDNYTPLHDTIANSDKNQVEICEYLCSQPNIDKIIQNNKNKTPLQSAKSLNLQNIVDILLRNGFTE